MKLIEKHPVEVGATILLLILAAYMVVYHTQFHEPMDPRNDAYSQGECP